MELEDKNGNVSEKETKGNEGRLTLAAVLFVIAILAGLVFVIYLLLIDPDRTRNIKDIMIIFIGLEMLLIGISTTILIVQLSKLVNLFQNEIKPLLESANETIYTLRGTAEFIGDSFVQPVVKLSSYMAALKKMLDLLNFKK